MSDTFDYKPGAASRIPLLSEALLHYAFNQADEFVTLGHSVREATSTVANFMLDAAWNVAASGAVADGFVPNKDRFRARIEDVMSRSSFGETQRPDVPAADAGKCPICAEPLRPDDLCASDITEGTCHAECLRGSPVVDLDTGEELPDGRVDTFLAREIIEPGRQQRDKFEAAVVKRLQESGFLEVEIRTECLARVGQGYQDEVINSGWHYWNEALWQNIPLVDPGFGRSPDGLDFATPDEVFDKGPEAVREWQEARGRKPETPPPSSHLRVDADAKALEAVEAIFADLRDRRFLKWLFDRDGDANLIGRFDNGEELRGLDLEVQAEIRADWQAIIAKGLSSTEGKDNG
ncbi:hypothetical protein [Rhizobium sp. AAP43]|uniref:hypothetical protein n=1 Tax=Rhizobium sp. AAP43 TaxID=1523420 RepID=UPI0006B97F01|nr:hypothetical protein [Rhizobium sp. AAP43]KPF47095.1 hypothetical protein IP76_02020 [Rhizobium sp. AAP43]